MDIDDPIQQLLKNTGWSCDDLLKKLQQYKSQKEKDQQVSADTGIENSISEKALDDTTNEEEKHNYSQEQVSQLDSSSRKEFSDTDEEETEVNVTHSNIIDEIIDDIASNDNVEGLDCLDEKTTCRSKVNTEEQEEITEVKVIEIGEDEDDCFIEESYSAIKHDSDPKNIQYMETFPRKPIKLIELTDDDIHMICKKNVSKSSNQEKSNRCDNENVASQEVLEDVSITNVKNVEILGNVPENDRGSDDLVRKCSPSEEEASNIPEKVKDTSLEKIVDKGNTAIIYESNSESPLKPQTKNFNNNCKTDVGRNNAYSNTENNNFQNVDILKEESTLTNFEDIRNNLKLQLNCLRTKKKGHFLQQLRTKLGDSSESNTKKLNSGSFEHTKKVYPNKSNETIKCLKKSPAERKEDNPDNIYTQTNEFGLVILSVEGGIDLKDNNEEANESNKQVLNAPTDDSSNTISSAQDNSVNDIGLQNKIQNDFDTNEVPHVFDEIRRIIRKQKQNNALTDKNAPTTSTPIKSVNDFDFFSKSADILSADNTQSSYTNDDTVQTVDKNSPFVSNTLEEFLTENSKLNISYKVPKCGAEEGLTDSYPEENPLILKKIIKADKEQRPILKKTQTIKAKTVAQKRKLLEKQRLKELRKQSKIIKKQTENTSGNISDTIKEKKYSYIQINNKKLWVRGTKPNICVAKINAPLELEPNLEQHHRKKKFSLLTELTKKYNEKIKYLPGPLSKKSLLQINGNDSWNTESKLLPQIILEVIPKVGHCMPPEIVSMLPKCDDGVVTADLAEFAISVLKTKRGNKEKVFKFPVKYINNQEKIIVKKRKVIPVNYNTEEKRYKEKSVNGVVADVIDDLIRYVEIKEIAPTLIKEDETEYNFNDSKLEEMPVIAENISSIIKKPQKKKSKVELELIRLSCKVVNVEVEENVSDESCNKPYCRLGCVCKSLKCDGMITYHCQNVSCMLECKCPREKSIEYDKLMLPPGTDILSRDTVTRIEDEAKKDLARVEREFTQMVIHTNDKTIVVGTGGRHKTRRSAKVPTKYSDYIDSNFESIEDDKNRNKEKNIFSKDCFVSLERLNLQDIIPYCLFHNLYNCNYCEGKHSSPPNNFPKKITIKSILSKRNLEEKAEQNKFFENKMSKVSKVTPPRPHRILKEPLSNPGISVNSQSHTETPITSASGRPIRVSKKLKESLSYSNELNFHSSVCARILGFPLRTKNNKRAFKTFYKLTKGDFANNISQADILKSKMFSNSPDTLEVDILKQQLTLESEARKKIPLLADQTVNINKHKRKQILEVRNDDITSKPLLRDLAIQRRKKCLNMPRRNTIIESVFEGEIIVDETNMELLQKMGNRTVMEGYARLLPWMALINSFNRRDIHIWCMVDQPSRLLINKNDKAPPKNYIDIRQSTQATEVIKWILSNELPQRYHEDHVSFILKQTKDNYEICGLCTKNFRDTNTTIEAQNEKELSTAMEADKNSVLFKHKDLNGMQQLLCLTKGKFKLQELVEENLAAIGETSIEKNRLYMWAALPEIYRMCKWRMVFLNSDFTFLYFTKVKYSIKYTDLLSASNTAKEFNCTVVLRNSVICNPYDHSAFGIYFDSHYQDRLFIGPYFKQHKDNDIETLRYINKSLVCTESFNKMQGKTDYKCGHWLIERPYSRSSEKVIDLTKENLSDKKDLKRKIQADTAQILKRLKSDPEENGKIIISQNKDLIQVLDSEPKKPEEFNRYIITNIPHLGYLGAFQHEDSFEIDVSWPFENKLLRFPTVFSAIDFLQCRFSSLLQPVPETFKISIIVLTDIDLEKSKPIDVSILSGHYICGEFGCYNVKTVTNEFCIDTIGTTREELLRIFAKRAQVFVRQKIEELADVVKIPKGEFGRLDIVHILSKAQENIESLKEQEKQCIEEKNKLLLHKHDLALKVFCLISTLPEQEKKIEKWKFRQILRKQSILVPETEMEPIEIADSDEEEQTSSSQKESSICQKAEPTVYNLNKTVSCDSSFMDQNSDLAEITPQTKPESIKVPSSKQSDLPKPFAVNKSLPVKVNKAAICTYPPQKKLKSILKSNTTTPPTTITDFKPGTSQIKNNVPTNPNQRSSETANAHYLTGIKLVKTGEGKLVLRPDKKAVTDSKPFTFSSTGGKQLVIKNNQVLSIKSIHPPPVNVQNVTEPKKSNVPNSPPKTIILKRSSLLKNPQLLLTGDDKSTPTQTKINEKSLLKPNLTPSINKSALEIIAVSNISPAGKSSNENEVITDVSDQREHSTKCDVNVKSDGSEQIVKIVEIPSKNNGSSALTEKDFPEDSKLTTVEEKFLLKPPDIENEMKADKQNVSISADTPDQCKDVNIAIPQVEPTIKSVEDQILETNLNTETNSNSMTENKMKDNDYPTSESEEMKTSDFVTKPNISSDGNNITENEDASNSDKATFLVNAVSETFPSEHDHEMSIQNNSTNAAALTQMKSAADNNFNCHLSSVVSEEENCMSKKDEKFNELIMVQTGDEVSRENAIAIYNEDLLKIMEVDAEPNCKENEDVKNSSSNILNNNEHNGNVNVPSNNKDQQLCNSNIPFLDEQLPKMLTMQFDRNNPVFDGKCDAEGYTENNNTLTRTNTYTMCATSSTLNSVSNNVMNFSNENILLSSVRKESIMKPASGTVDVNENKFDESDKKCISNIISQKNDSTIQANISLGNILDSEILLKICSAAVKKDYTNTEPIKNINVSVSVQISAPLNQNEAHSVAVLEGPSTIRDTNINSEKSPYMKKTVHNRRILRKPRPPIKYKARIIKRSSKRKLIFKQYNATTKTCTKDVENETDRESLNHERESSKISEGNIQDNYVTGKGDTQTSESFIGESTSEKSQVSNNISNPSGSIQISEDKSNKDVVVQEKQPQKRAYNKRKNVDKSSIKKSKRRKRGSIKSSSILQTSTEPLNECLPKTEDYQNANDKQISSDATEIVSPDDKSQCTEVRTENTASKFPESKRISNVVIHKLKTENCPNICDSAKENTKTNTTKETQTDNLTYPVTEKMGSQGSSNDKNILYLYKNDNAEKNIGSKVQQSTRATQIPAAKCVDLKSNNSILNRETSSKINYKRGIKYVGAKVDTTFTIDKASFSKYVKRVSKSAQKNKDALKQASIPIDSLTKICRKLENRETEEFRLRKEAISTDDLVYASEIILTENKESSDISDKVSAVDDGMSKVKDLMDINKENFLRNAAFAEKIINIGNMRKKLYENIYEDNLDQN